MLEQTYAAWLRFHKLTWEVVSTTWTHSWTSAIISTSLLALGLMSLSFLRTRRKRGSTLPGPAGLPILGNVLQIPLELQFIRFTEWSQQYGPIFGLNLLGQRVVVLNTYQVSGDLLDRCSHIYNDRPRMIMASEILAGGIFMSLMRHGRLLRKMRRAMHESFNPRVVDQYQAIQSEAATLAMLRTLARPESWEHNIEVFTASSIFSSVYGWPALDPESPHVEYIRNIVDHVAKAATPGAFLVDILPIMRYLPSGIARWKRDGLAWHKRTSDVFTSFYEGARSHLPKGEGRASFSSSLAQGGERFGLSEKESSWLAAVTVAGGADTTAMAVKNCILAMLHYPAVLHKARDELNAVVGRDRAPSFRDKDHLPYVQAIVRETLRWRPVIPLGVPHAATEDNWYQGYFIPKGTIVIGNVWAMNRDPQLYPDFDTFRPERHLTTDGKLVTSTPDTHQMGHASFGFGRRICPGMHFADQALFIMIATLLWGFDIHPATDESGSTVLPPVDEYGDVGLVGRPAPFRCTFTPRGSEVRAILEESVAAGLPVGV